MIERASEHGTPGLVIDQPGSIAQLAIAVANRREVPVAYVPGLVMRRAADLYPGESKTDRRDAFVIADTGRTRRRSVHWLDAGNDELLHQLRVLNGFDIDLAADLTRLTNRLRDSLVSVSPALERALGSRLHRAGVRDLLAKFPTPAALRAAGRARITTAVKKRSPRVATKVVDAVTAALDAQSVTMPAEAAVGRVIAELATELDRIHTRRDALAAEIEEVFLAHPFGQVLVTLPGIGPRTGARILAEIGDGTRFANGSKLASYAGLAPVTRQSGTSIRGESQSRRGNHRLKNAMFLAAFASLRSTDSKAKTTESAPRARSTTPQSSASPAAAATSSSPCSATSSPTGHPRPRRSARTRRSPLEPLTGTWGHLWTEHPLDLDGDQGSDPLIEYRADHREGDDEVELAIAERKEPTVGTGDSKLLT